MHVEPVGKGREGRRVAQPSRRNIGLAATATVRFACHAGHKPPPHHEVDAPVFGQARVVVDARDFETVDWHEAGIALSVRDLAEALEAIGRHVDALHARNLHRTRNDLAQIDGLSERVVVRVKEAARAVDAARAC